MSAPESCEECRAIERELDQAREEISGDLTNERSTHGRMHERYAQLHELAGEDAVERVPQELLDWAKWSYLVAANEPTAMVRLRQAVARKFRHEWSTGHRIGFPYAA